MSAIKAVFLFCFSLACLGLVGSSLSHLWRTSRLLVLERRNDRPDAARPAADTPAVSVHPDAGQ